MNKTYTPCHVHSQASLLDGLSKPKNIAKRCNSVGINSCALSDHGSLSESISYINACKQRKVKPVLGCELYICDNKPDIKNNDNRSLSHLVVLAKNLQGWKQLMRLVSRSNSPEFFYYKPRLDLETLAEYLDGNIIGFAGHLGSTLSKCIFTDTKSIHNCSNEDEMRQYVNPNWVSDTEISSLKMQDMFGRGNFFLEVQLVDGANSPAAIMLAKGMRYISKKTGIPCIGTPDAHYTTKDEAVDQRILLCSSMNIQMPDIQKNSSKGDIALSGFFRSDNFHIPSYDEMIAYGNTEEELDNTNLIDSMCEIYDITSKPRIPKFPCPSGLDAQTYLRQVCREGWINKLSNIENVIKKGMYSKSDYVNRIESEMSILQGAKLDDYFLIVNDIIKWARSDGQLTGAGRGSAGGSIILYLLGVSHVDPIENNLLFERFYDDSRKESLPDVDMDFEHGGRDKVVNYLRGKYGKNKVSHMLTFGRLQGRGALKEVLRVKGACSFEEMNKITKYIPDEARISDQLQIMKEEDKANGGDGDASILQWALENNSKDLKEWAFLDDDGKVQGPLAKLFEQAMRIEGTKKSQGKHASGIIIADQDLAEICPMAYDKGENETVVGWSMEDADAAGLVKFDLLSVNLLNKIHGVMDLLK